MRGDVRLAYNAAHRDRLCFSKPGKLANELRLVYRDGWGVLDDGQHGRALLSILLHTIANCSGDRPAKMAEARREFAPWLPDAEMGKLADEAIRVHRRWKPDKLAQRIGLNLADRTRLRITMIGATDADKAKRDRLRKERMVEAKCRKRWAAGVVPRATYEATSLSRTEPWKAEGISRRTWERRRKRLPQVREQHKEVTSIAAVTLAAPSLAAQPQPTKGSLLVEDRGSKTSHHTGPEWPHLHGGMGPGVGLGNC